MKSAATCAFAIMLLAVLVGLQTASAADAQATASVKLSGKTVSINYSAPAMKGRRIFGELVPYGKVWPAGGTPAKLHTDAAIDIQGLSVPKGDYSLFLIPDPKGWQLVVNKEIGPQAATYDQKKDLGRVRLRVSQASAPIETYSMKLSGTGMAGKLEVGWEKTIVAVSFYIDAVKESSEW